MLSVLHQNQIDEDYSKAFINLNLKMSSNVSTTLINTNNNINDNQNIIFDKYTRHLSL